MATGGFFGGLAQGISDEQDRQLKLIQQTDDNVYKTLSIAGNVIKSAVESGADPAKLTSVVTPLIENAANLAGTTYGKLQGETAGKAAAERIRMIGQSMLATPAKANSDAQPYSFPVDPETGKLVAANKSTGLIRRDSGVVPEVQPSSNQTQQVQQQPQQTAMANPYSVGDVIPGSRTVTDIPPGAPAVPSSAPVVPNAQVAQGFEDAGIKPSGAGGLTADAIELRARQYLDGNPEALKGIPRNNIGNVKINAITNRAAEIASERGLTPEDVNAKQLEFKAKTKGAQVLGGREATLQGAISNIIATAPIVTELSDKINRTQYPLINQLILAGKQQTGDPDVVRLGIALNTVTNAYARAQGGGNNVLTDHAREEARQLLQLSYSDGQLKAGVDQLLIETQREKKEVGHALQDYLKLRDKNIEQNAAPPSNVFIGTKGTQFREIP